MSKIAKIKNLQRLNFKKRIRILAILLKKIGRIKLSRKETEIYLYYNYLILFKGIFVEESETSITSVFNWNRSIKLKMRKYPSSDFDVFHQVFYWNGYLPLIKKYKNYFQSSNKNNVTIIDCGSNIGLTSLFFLNFFPKAKIVTIEPEPGNFKILTYNLGNFSSENVIKLQGAVWSKSSKMRISKDFRDGNDWSVRVEETEEGEQIQAYSLGEILEKYSLNIIDILKMDVEGAEKEIFTSPAADLDFLQITKCIALEIHDEFNCREEICRILRDNHFFLETFGELTLGYNQKLIHQ